MSERTFELEQYHYTDAELLSVGLSVGQANKAVADLLVEREMQNKLFGANLKAAQKHRDEETEKLNNRYEMREVEYITVLDDPQPGMKRLIRVDNNKPLRTEPMTFAEKQQSFGFKDPDGDA
jgi:uncharacterized protein YoaH (UPF0181 family)